MITITGLDDFPGPLSVLPLADGRTALACTHLPTPNTPEIAYSAAYLVTPAGVATKVGQSEPQGKDIACALEIVGTTLRLWVTEAIPGGGGATAKPDRYDFPIGVGAAGVGGLDNGVRALLRTIARSITAALGA